jgi:hypothetical protein
MLPRYPLISKGMASTSAVHDARLCPTSALLATGPIIRLMNFSVAM